MLPFRIIIWFLTPVLFTNGLTPEQFMKEVENFELSNDLDPSALNFLNCKIDSIKTQNFEMERFLGEWYELAKSYSRSMDLHSAMWKFVDNSDSDYKFYYTAVAGDNNCIRPLRGKVDVFDGELYLSYSTFSSVVKEKMVVVYTDYENIAVLYSCLYTIPQTESCHPAAVYGVIISRSKTLNSKKLQSALMSVKNSCIDPRTLQHRHSEVNCWFDDDFRTDEEDIPGPDFCYENPDAGYCRGNFQRYYYDWKSDKCSVFRYSGCGGNDNNFLVLHECQKKCQNLRRNTQCPETAECALNCPPCCREVDGCIKCDCDSVVIEPPGPSRKDDNCIQSPADCTPDCPLQSTSPGCFSCVCIPDVFRAPVTHRNIHEFRVLNPGDCPGRCRIIMHPNELICNCANQDICVLPKDSGMCDGNELMYYFNSHKGKCEAFSYSGCEGNLNRFKTLEKCIDFCGDICELPKKQGICKSTIKKFYFDHDSMLCNSFPYSGCEGNENNFISEENCKKRCLDVCEEPVDPGHCSENIKRYYYDTTTKSCQEFTFTGCMGNKNNFYTLSECQRKCEGISLGFVIRNKSICQLPVAVGPCKKFVTRFYYDSVNRTCEEFKYGGCEGNENNFESNEDCSGKCHGVRLEASCMSKHCKDPSNDRGTNIHAAPSFIVLIVFGILFEYYTYL
ncbi:papilin-like isoform X2 [Centruroides vittatus]|uniref:papilin-like isoform X2 n=1 Tax=Centruroides vittatus TaxID=120091 RepID=UPI00350FDA23